MPYRPPKIDPRNCVHPDHYLVYSYSRRWDSYLGKYVSDKESMNCRRCGHVLCLVNGPADFVAQREFKYEAETGKLVVPRDVFGNEIVPGVMVVFPKPKNTMGWGIVEAVNHKKTVTDLDRALRPRVDAPDRIKVSPDERHTKGVQDYFNRRADGTPKSITLIQGAASAVVIG